MGGQERAVHWREEMFVGPQHFQTAQRYFEHYLQRGEKFDLSYNWGLRSIRLDPDALTNYRCVVHRLEARLPGGAVVKIPDDGTLEPADLKQAFVKNTEVTVYLAVPLLHLGRANSAPADSKALARYQVRETEVADENAGGNHKAILVRSLNAKLGLSTGDLSGYERLPIARLVKSEHADAVPKLDLSYIPPLLACDGWPPLNDVEGVLEGEQVGIMQSLLERINKKIEYLSSRLVSGGIRLDSDSEGDPLLVAQLRELNETYAEWFIMGSAFGVHPLRAYAALCRLVGNLAIFGPQRRPPQLPRYDHNNLGHCFHTAKRHVDGLLNAIVEPEFTERAFVGAGLQMQLRLEPEWIESAWKLFIGVRSQLDREQCIRLLTGKGELDMKLGSNNRVDDLFKLGEPGLTFAPVTGSEIRVLPKSPDEFYFLISRDRTQLEWQEVARSLRLAIRVNERMVIGEIQGKKAITVRHSAETTKLAFKLYLIPPGTA